MKQGNRATKALSLHSRIAELESILDECDRFLKAKAAEIENIGPNGGPRRATLIRQWENSARKRWRTWISLLKLAPKPKGLDSGAAAIASDELNEMEMRILLCGIPMEDIRELRALVGGRLADPRGRSWRIGPDGYGVIEIYLDGTSVLHPTIPGSIDPPAEFMFLRSVLSAAVTHPEKLIHGSEAATRALRENADELIGLARWAMLCTPSNFEEIGKRLRREPLGISYPPPAPSRKDRCDPELQAAIQLAIQRNAKTAPLSRRVPTVEEVQEALRTVGKAPNGKLAAPVKRETILSRLKAIGLDWLPSWGRGGHWRGRKGKRPKVDRQFRPDRWSGSVSR